MSEKPSERKRYCQVTLNSMEIAVVRQLLESRAFDAEDFLFLSQWDDRLGILEVPRQVNPPTSLSLRGVGGRAITY
jgi:hypothetical protein